MPESSHDLSITTLGGLEIRYHEKPLPNLASRKAEALLVYLACVGRPIARDTLADMLWDDLPSERARGNLSVLLSSLRQQLAGYIQADRSILAFDRRQRYWLDVAALEGAWQAYRVNTNHDTVQQLEQAVDLYQGDFLQGFTVREAAGFEAWVVEQQERLRRIVVEARQALFEAATKRGADNQAIDHARRLLWIDPLREDIHRELIRLHAVNGQRSAALEQYEICRRALNEELGVTPSTETEALRTQILAGELRPRQAPPTTVSRPSFKLQRTPFNNLPAQPTPFLGRTSELAQIVQRLGDPACRLLTLLGPGGIGKTRLALQAAALHSSARPDGVAFVALASVEGLDQLVDAIGKTLNLSFVGQRDPVAHLLEFLRERHMLMVLDNFEHLIELAEFVGNMLDHAPQLAVIVTSRERLALRAEWLLDVAGLAYPPQLEEASALGRYSAVQLFVQQASRVQPRFRFSPENAGPILRICELLEGAPLGIELAAGWARSASCEEIAGTIAGTLDALATDLRDVPARHRSMRAVFNHSWKLLSEVERAVMGQIAVFRGGWTGEAAAYVCGALLPEAEREVPIASLLDALIDQSLLRRAGDRYTVHELLRQFAAEALATADGAQHTAQERHSRYFLGVIAVHGVTLNGRQAQIAAEAIRADLDNIRAAWQWAVSEQAGELLLSAADGLSAFYEMVGLAREAAELFGSAAAAFAKRDQPTDRQIHARLLAEQGRFLQFLGEYDVAAEKLAIAAGLAGELGDTSVQALARYLWGDLLGCQGRYVESQTQLADALELANAANNLALETDTLGARGTIEEEQGNYAEASRTYAQTLELSRALDDQQRESLALTRLGVVAEEQGQYAHARDYYAQALAIHRARGNRPGEAMVLNNLGVVHRDESDYDAARVVLSQSLAIGQELGNRRLMAVVHTNFGDVGRDLGNYQAALEHYQQAISLRDSLGNRYGVCQNLTDLSLVLHLTGDDEAAHTYGQQALDAARALGVRSTEAFALTHLGHALVGLEQPEEAAAAYQHALDIRRELGQPTRAMDALAGLVRTLLIRGETQIAHAYTEEIFLLLQSGPLHGAEEPARIALTCYQAFAAANDPRATTVLRDAYQQLHERMAGIADPDERRTFIEFVQTHQALAYAFQKQVAAAESNGHR